MVILVTMQCCNLLDAGLIGLLIRSQLVVATVVNSNYGLLRLLLRSFQVLAFLQTNLHPEASLCI